MKSSIFRVLRQSVVSLLCLSILASSSTAFASASWSASHNWSGYAVTGRTFNKVQGEVTVPNVTCTTSTAENLYWVGFDGYAAGDPTVEQTGVAALCSKVNAAPIYYGWYEMYGGSGSTNVHRISTSSFDVKPGDEIGESVTYSPTNETYTMELQQIGSNVQPAVVRLPGYSRSRQSAEWIAERFNQGMNSNNVDTFTPLGKFSYSPTLFTYAAASTNTSSKLESISSYNYAGIDMVTTESNWHKLAATDALGNGGTSFGVTWMSAE